MCHIEGQLRELFSCTVLTKDFSGKWGIPPPKGTLEGEGDPRLEKKTGTPSGLMKRGYTFMACEGGCLHSRLGGDATLIPWVGVGSSVPGIRGAPPPNCRL